MNASFPPSSERIRAYLDDTLDKDELERFELELFRDPQLLDAVEAERLLRQGLRDIDAELRERALRLAAPPAIVAVAPPAVVAVAPPPVVAVAPPAAVAAPRRRRQRRVSVPVLTVAALLLVVLIPAGLWLRRGEVSDAFIGNVHTAQLGQLRGSRERVQLPPQADNLQLLIPQLAQEGVLYYRVEVQGPNSVRLARGKLKPGLDGQLSFIVPAEELRAGDYAGRIIAQRRDGSSQTVGELDFQLEMPAAAVP